MNKWLISIAAIVLVIAIVSFAGYQYVQKQIHGTVAQEAFELTIEPGESLRQVLSELEDEGLVGNAGWRYVYMRFKQPDFTYQAGDYLIEKGTSLEKALQQFQNGDVIDNSLKVTIPEGWTVEQIVTRLVEENFGEEETFKELLYSTHYYEQKQEQFTFLPPLTDDIKSPFEGFLFPDTYTFDEGVTEEEIVELMLAQTERIVDKLASENPQMTESLSQTFTLASIVEKETTVTEERPRVAGVFYNRLEQGWKLEADSTVQYALEERKERLLYEDLEIDDPYNTYAYNGLPPGPIASPGLSSLEAVLAPEQNDFLFFVTKKDGSETHYFAKTFDEHKQNRAKSEAHAQKQ